MTKKRKIKDGILQALTALASASTVLILVSVFAFVIIKGKDTLSFEMLTNKYWSQNYLVEWDGNNTASSYEVPNNEEIYYSEKFGIGVKDVTNHEKKRLLEVEYIAEDSVFNQSINATNGPGYLQALSISENDTIEKLDIVDGDGNVVSIGLMFGDNAETFIQKLDQATAVESLYYKTAGGGIWGSLIATLMLIGTSLLFALPLGLFAAIYLTEIAPKNKRTALLEQCIEMLAGVPSIIFGLMGILVFFPITAMFNVTGLSILLGAMTMSVILLPVIIRSVQESLRVVPMDYRLSSLSLGATETQTIFRVVLPTALPGVLSAVLLAISRIIGESAALIYTMGTFINDSPQLQQGATTLAVHIWSIMSQEQPNFELASAISIIILLLVFALNLSVKYISRRIQKKQGV